MRRRTKIVAASVAAVLALAAGTTAIAATGGGPLGLFGDRDDHRAEEAQALGKKLGVDPARVDRAMQEVHQERRDARRDEMSAALAKKLGVPQADVARALDKAFAAKRAEFDRARESGQRPDRGERGEHRDELARAVAAEVNKPPEEVQKALEAVHQERFEVRLAEGVKEGRITEKQADEIRREMKPGFGPGHGGPGHGGPGGHGGFGGAGPDGPDRPGGDGPPDGGGF